MCIFFPKIETKNKIKKCIKKFFFFLFFLEQNEYFQYMEIMKL